MQRALPGFRIASAGLAAIAGRRADATMAGLLREDGYDLSGHRARPISLDVALNYDLLLVMELAHKQILRARYPAVTGRVMLLGHWLGAGEEVADPYQKDEVTYRRSLNTITAAVGGWTERLSGGGNNDAIEA